MTRPATTTHRWLDFVHAQSYGKSIGTIAPGFRPPRVPGLAGPEEPLGWDDVGRLLYTSFGTLRVDAAGAHRAYPSPRSLFAVHAYLVGADGAWRYDPLRHALQPVEGSRRFRFAGRAQIALVGSYASIPPAYGPLRFALTVLEAGHALRALRSCAAGHGLRAHVRLEFSDQDVLARLRLPLDGTWGPLALVELDRAPFDDETARDTVAEIERACWTQPGDDTPDERLFARTSGRNAGGLSASVASIPVELARAAAAEASRPLAAVGLRLLVVAERVNGLEDGLYQVAGGSLTRLRGGRLLAGVQRAYAYPAETANIRSMNLAWMLVVDYRTILSRHGARGLRWAQLEMGWTAQGIACALAAGGLFARPIRSYHEAVLDGLLDLGPRESVGYQLLCGVPRWEEPAFDLRPCEVWP